MKTLLLVSLLTTGSFVAMAQVERTPVPATGQTESVRQNTKDDQPKFRDLLKQLNLTRKQQTQLKQLRADQQSQKTAIENNEQLTGEEKKKQLRELQKKHMINIQSILTDEQKEKLKTLRQKQEPIPTDDKDG